MREAIENKEYLTTHEAAKLLYITPATVIQWEKKGHIKVIKTIGGHRRIPRSEINKTLKKMGIDNIKV